MNTRFIYDEKTSSLYSPDGQFLKVVSCPKAKHWNQLIVEEGENRWRECKECQENVVDLDAMETDKALELVGNQWSSACIHASRNSEKVIFLKDKNSVPPADKLETDNQHRMVIKTARTIDDINRAASMGYHVDIRRVLHDREKLYSIMSIGQDPETGRIETSGDLRYSFRESKSGFSSNSEYQEIFPFFCYYPYFQSTPVAGYLVPKGTPDGTEVIIEDPIEDFVGATHHGRFRAKNVLGHIKGLKVVINESDIVVQEFIG